MASTSSGRQDWDEAGFRRSIQRYFDSGVKVRNREGKVPSAEQENRLLSSIYDLGFAIHHDDTLKADQFFRELSFHFGSFEVKRCLVLCGAEASFTLLRYVVEKQYVSITYVLSREIYRNVRGENALHIAIENSRNDVVDYLLKDWVQIPVRILQLSEDLRLRMLSLVVGRREQIIVCAFGHI